ncbi:hypothetical protein PROFUN_11926 [Planoprotostelium fungivorum]|uniref:Protein kinase domain-containing protein n=1 Tax=Planoprotostelium fungivorum TaxID=1890364 RepID=A0A2P6N8R2_9EUKA|nr:hypothetical protein PROFUN_11926 [Planoprotostelium fungivorum]
MFGIGVEKKIWHSYPDAKATIAALHLSILVYDPFVFCQHCQGDDSQSQNRTKVYVVGDFHAQLGKNKSVSALSVYQDRTLTPFIDEVPESIGDVSHIHATDRYIYVAGKYREVRGSKANSVVRYDTYDDTWTSLCGGVFGEVLSIDALGAEVFVAGKFDSAVNCDGKVVNSYGIARFNTKTQQWRSKIGELAPAGRSYSSIAVATDGSNGAIIWAAGTAIDGTTGKTNPFVAMWNDTLGAWREMEHAIEKSATVYRVIDIDPYTQQVFLGGIWKSVMGESVRSVHGLAVYREMDGQSSFVDVAGLPLLFRNDNGIYDIDFMQVNGSNWVIMGGKFKHQYSDIMNLAIYDYNEIFSPMTVYQTSLSCIDVNLAIIRDINVFSSVIYFSGRFDTVTVMNNGTSTNMTTNSFASYDVVSHQFSDLDSSSLPRNALVHASAVVERGDIIAVASSQSVDGVISYGSGMTCLVRSTKLNSWKFLFDQISDSFLDYGRLTSMDSEGDDIYVGGQFEVVGDNHYNNVAQWNGTAWLHLGGGISNGKVYTVKVYRNYLYVGGFFNSSLDGGKTLNSIARYNLNESRWETMQSGVDGVCGSNNTVYTIEAKGDYVYVGGSFRSVSGIKSPNLIVWSIEEEEWKSVYNEPSYIYGEVYALSLQDWTLFIGGRFTFNTSRLNHDHFVSYDINSTEFSQRSYRFTSRDPTKTAVFTLLSFNDSLLVGGIFDQVDEVTVNNIVNLTNGLRDPQSLDQGVVASDFQPAVYDIGYHPNNNVLVVVGAFSTAGSVKSTNVVEFSISDQTWFPLSSSVTQWVGQVRAVHVAQPSTVLIADHDDSAFKFYLTMFILLGSSIIVIAVLGYLIYRYRRNRNPYMEIPNYDTSQDNSMVYNRPPTRERVRETEASVVKIEASDIQLGETIASGTAGDVMKGQYKGREIAVKKMAFKPSQVTHRFREEYYNEIRLMSAMDHPNILRFLGASISSNGDVMLLSEFMDFGSIRDLMQKEEKISFNLKCRLASDAARGVSYLHNCKPPILHRDLKSSNLLVDRRWRCKVADFGVSRIRPVTASNCMTKIGTPSHMAPEVILQNRWSEKSDAFSFGIFLIELYNERPAYDGVEETMEEITHGVAHRGLRPVLAEDCPTSLAVLIKDCLHNDPPKRPSFLEIKQRLKRI